MDKKTITADRSDEVETSDRQTHAENKTEKIHCVMRAQACLFPCLNVFFLCLFSVIKIENRFLLKTASYLCIWKHTLQFKAFSLKLMENLC